MEIWKSIKDYEGIYEVSSSGRIKSLGNNKDKKEKILKFGRRRGGYYCVNLNKNKTNKNVSVHRIVAFAFPEICGEWFEGAVCHHRNEVRTDNRAENLQWVTNKYNSRYGTSGLRKGQKMKNNPGVSRKIIQYDLEGNFICEYPSMREAERQTGICSAGIGACARNQKWYKTAGGFKWGFSEN